MNPTPDTSKTNNIKQSLFQVTQTSKYLAMMLFIAMPFIGGWIGYSLAPIKTVVIETKVDTYATSEAQSLPEIESAQIINEGDVEVTFSNGTKNVVAMANKPASQEQYYEIETYTKPFISPNRKFVALQGIGFEDSFVRIYNVDAGRLEAKIYGEVLAWDNVGRLSILACDLSGEECANYISESGDAPWVLEEVGKD